MKVSTQIIKERIEKLKKPRRKKILKPQNKLNAFMIATELVSGCIIGVIIGLFFDKLFDSKPLYLIICLLLGIAASCKIIWSRISKEKDGT